MDPKTVKIEENPYLVYLKEENKEILKKNLDTIRKLIEKINNFYSLSQSDRLTTINDFSIEINTLEEKLSLLTDNLQEIATKHITKAKNFLHNLIANISSDSHDGFERYVGSLSDTLLNLVNELQEELAVLNDDRPRLNSNHSDESIESPKFPYEIKLQIYLDYLETISSFEDLIKSITILAEVSHEFNAIILEKTAINKTLSLIERFKKNDKESSITFQINRLAYYGFAYQSLPLLKMALAMGADLDIYIDLKTFRKNNNLLKINYYSTDNIIKNPQRFNEKKMYSLMHIAAEKGWIKVLELCLKATKKFNIKTIECKNHSIARHSWEDRYHYVNSLLGLAIKKGNIAMMRMFLKIAPAESYAAAAHEGSRDIAQKFNGYTCKTLSDPLTLIVFLEHSENIKIEMINLLIDDGKLSPNGIFNDNSPLLNAIKGNHFNLVKLFIAHRAEIKSDYILFSPSVAIAEVLVGAGADPKTKNANNETALVIALRNKDIALFNYLIQFYDEMPIDITKRNLFHVLGRSIFTYNTVIDVIIQQQWGTTLIDHKDANGDTPLLTAWKFNNIIVAKQLLDNGANPNIPNNKGETLLSLLEQSSCPENVVIWFKNRIKIMMTP